jgi:fibronectin-binding autotransporter adhesin
VGTGSSTVTNAYGALVQTTTKGSIAPTNNYGIYIQDQSGIGGTGNYNIYSAGSGTNYFQSGATLGNTLTFAGTSSGQASFGVAAAAGTPNTVLLPTTTGTNGQCLQTNGGSPQQTSWASCGGSSPTLNSIIAATGSNSISNGNNNQTWQFSLTGSTDGHDYAESSASSGTGSLLSAGTVLSSTAFPLSLSVTGSSTNTYGNQVALKLYNPTAATSTVPQFSPQVQWCANYWNGSASAPDCWVASVTAGGTIGANTPSVLNFIHSGSSSSLIGLGANGFLSGVFRSSSATGAVTYQSGYDINPATTAYTIGTATVRGGDLLAGSGSVIQQSGDLVMRGGNNATQATAAGTRGGNVTINGGNMSAATQALIAGTISITGGSTSSTNTGTTGGGITLAGGTCNAVTSATTCPGNIKLNQVSFTTGTANVNDLACVTAANTIAGCATSAGTGAFVGVIDSISATNNVLYSQIALGGTHTFNATSATFTNGHFVCESGSSGNLVVDSATICSAGFGVGIYIGATGTQTTPLVLMQRY